MADELELTVDRDLVPILNQVVSVVERRSKRKDPQTGRGVPETPEVRSIRLQREGMAKVRSRYEELASHLEAVEKATNVGELRAAMAPLQAIQKSSAGDGWGELTQLNGYLNNARSAPDDARFSTNVGATAAKALARVAALRTKLDADDAALVIQGHKAAQDARKARPALKKAINELKDGLTADALRKAKQHQDQARGALANAETVLQTWSPDPASQTSGLGKRHRDAVAKAATRLAEADPDLVVLAKVRNLVDKLPTESDERKLLKGIADEMAVGVMNRTAGHRHRQLEAGLAELQRAGGSISRTLNVSAGVELGTVGVLASAKAKLGYSYTVAMSRTAAGGWQAAVTHKGTAGAGAKVGSKQTAEANVNADGSLARTEVFTYGSAAELVAELDTTLLKMTVGAGRSDAKTAQSFEKRRRALLADTEVNRDRLTDQMTRVEATSQLPPDRRNLPLASPDLERIERTRAVTWTGQLGLGAGGSLADFGQDEAGWGRGGFEASGSVAFKISRTKKFKRTSYLDSILNNPLEQELEAGTGAGLARHAKHGTEGHAATRTYYDQLRQRAESIQELAADADDPTDLRDEAKNIRALVRDDIERLAVEFDMFAQLRHRHTEPGSKDPNAEQLYRQILKDRGLGKGDKNKAARYMKAMMLQYAMLRRLYDSVDTGQAGAGDNGGDGGGAPDDARFRRAMAEFEDRLRTPPIELSDDERKAAFGEETVSDGSVKVSTIATVKGSFGSGAARSGQRVAGAVTDEVKFKGFGGTLAASMTYSTTPGKPDSSSVGIVLDFSAGAVKGSGSSTEKITPDVAEELAGDLAAKVLDRALLRKLTGGEGGQEQVVADWKRAVAASLMKASGRLEISIAPTQGVWRLQSVAAVERSTTGLQLGGSIPVGPTSVAVSAGIHQTKKRVEAVYHNPNTLGQLTNLHRMRLPDGATSTAGWDAMRKKSKQLRNVVKALADTADGAKTANGDDLAAVLAKVKDGSLVESDAASWKLNNPSNANELVPWLLALKSGSPDQAKAADDFIDGYTANAAKLKRSANAVTRAEALDRMEQLFNGVVGAKRAIEDEAEAKSFFIPRHLSRAEVNRVVADKLADKYFDLELRVHEKLHPNADDDALVTDWVGGPRASLTDLRKRLAAARQTNPDDAELIEFDIQARSLRHAVESTDDLTRFNSTKGKEAALARLAHTVNTVFTEPKIYMEDENLYGVVQRRRDGTPIITSEGGLKVRPHVAADKAALLTDDSIKASLRRARAKDTGGGLDIRPHVEIDLGGPEKKRYWKASDADERRRNAHIADRRTEGRYVTKRRAEKDVKERSDLSEAFETLVDNEAEKRRRKRWLQRIRRRREAAQEDDD